MVVTRGPWKEVQTGTPELTERDPHLLWQSFWQWKEGGEVFTFFSACLANFIAKMPVL